MNQELGYIKLFADEIRSRLLIDEANETLRKEQRNRRFVDNNKYLHQ